MNKYSAIEQKTKQQNGVISTSQLLGLGLSKKNIDTLRRNNFLTSAGRSIYLICGSPDTWHQQATIETFRYKNCLLSHESVLHLYNIFDFKFEKQKFQFKKNSTRHLIHVLNRYKYVRNKSVFVHRSSQLLENDIGNTHLGIKHVSLERAIVDCSHQLDDHELGYAIEKSIRMRLTTLNRIHYANKVLGLAYGRDVTRIRKIISDTVNINSKHDIGSYFEKYVEDILSPISVFKLRRQYEICASDIKMRVDFAILELKIIIEADGFDHHGGRSAYDKDKLRYALLQSQGWLVLNLTTNMSVQILQKLFSDMQNLRLKTVCA